MAKKKYDKGLILRTAFKISKEIGLESMSMRMLARELGCSVMPIYDAFESKEDLIRELNDYCVRDTMFELNSKSIYQRYRKMTEYGITYPKFFLDFVKLGKNHIPNPEVIQLLCNLVKQEKGHEYKTEKELLTMNGKVEVFIIGIVFISMRDSHITKERVEHLLQMVDETARQIFTCNGG